MKNFTLFYLFIILALSIPNSLIYKDLKKDISKANLELLEEFNLQENERVTRVETYLSLNPNAKRSLSNANQIIYIYDIIDGKPIYRGTDNLDAALATKTTHLQPGGSLNLNLDGSGMTVGVWDGGPAQAAHTEF